MEKSKVYLSDFRATLGEGMPTKLKRLIKKAGIGQIDMDGKFVAIKMNSASWATSASCARTMRVRLSMWS